MKSAIDLAPVNEGDVLFGRYRIERAIGRGGMAVVVAATHLQLDQLVAIKFLLPHVLMEPDVVARFTREARAAVRIRNEHVARVMDVGNLESGAPFIVMEYLEGQDLSSVVRSRGALPVAEAVDYILQACEALAVAHGLGIVHRDLKPANLFLVESHGANNVKVLDFGISKNMGLTTATSGSDAGMTQSAFLLGSPSYMSPEQMNSAKNVDGLTDIWALGVTLYELLTGEAPFQAESLPFLCMEILQKPPRPLRALAPNVPEALERVVFCCLEKDKTRRYQSIAEFAVALEPFAPARSRLSLERISALGAKPPPAPNSLPASRSASAPSLGSPASPRTAFEPREPTVALDGPPDFPGLENASGVDPATASGASPEPTASGNTAWQHTAAQERRPARRTPLFIAAGAAVALIGGALVIYSLGGSGTPDVQSGTSTSAAPSAALAESPPKHTAEPPAPRAAAPPVEPPASAAEPELAEPARSAQPAPRTPPAPKPALTQKPRPQPARANPARKPPPSPRATPSWEDER